MRRPWNAKPAVSASPRAHAARRTGALSRFGHRFKFLGAHACASRELIVGINVMLSVVACMLFGAFELTLAPLKV